MVIEKILKVNSTDPKVDDLRKRLQALQQKPESTSQAPAGAKPVTEPPKPGAPVPPPSSKDDIKKLQELSFQEQKSLMERNNPELRLREERTNHLIMNQIKELITLNNEATKRIKDLENKQADLLKQFEGFKGKNEEAAQKMNSIDSRLEKFMGLYELITAQYNPFADAAAKIPQSGRQFPAMLPKAVPTATPPAASKPAETFHVEDNITKQSATVEVKKEDMHAADTQFKRVEELLADLQKKQTETQEPLPQPPQEVTSELHTLLMGFEQRLSKQFDQSLQEKLHQRFAALEVNLQAELRDALRAEIEKAQADDADVQQAMLELQHLMQSTEAGRQRPVEDELATLTKELEQVRKDFQLLPEALHFHLADGRVLKSLENLKAVLPTMQPDLYNQHVSKERNDFASWVEHALQQPELAGKMRAAPTSAELITILR